MMSAGDVNNDVFDSPPLLLGDSSSSSTIGMALQSFYENTSTGVYEMEQESIWGKL